MTERREIVRNRKKVSEIGQLRVGDLGAKSAREAWAERQRTAGSDRRDQGPAPRTRNQAENHWGLLARHHSLRRACMGWMDAARRAGMRPETSTVNSRSNAAAKKLTGSKGVTPKSMERSRRTAAMEAAAPAMSPKDAVSVLPRSTRRKTPLRVEPRAMRNANSRWRSMTE